jgi:hypothetical protein
MPGRRGRDDRLAPFANPNSLVGLAQIDFGQLVLVHQFDEPANPLDVEYVALTWTGARHYWLLRNVFDGPL